MNGQRLLVFSPFCGSPGSGNKIILTRKLIDGMIQYSKLWNGPVTLVCRSSMAPGDDLDPFEIDPRHAPFEVIAREFSEELLSSLLAPGSIVLAALCRELIGLSQRCRTVGIPCIYTTEYSLRTRLEIIQLYRKSILHGAWKTLKERRLERAQIRALSRANGVQCNGTPTYDAYKDVAPFPLLFFDSRIHEGMLAPMDRIKVKCAGHEKRRPLRLVFSGRLKRMKGADQLAMVALHLKNAGVPFHMYIFGDGECGPQLRHEVVRLGLTECVSLKGAVDFERELVPWVSEEADLFVCCHRQGDPSCTYLETMACGVPIVGYDNEACGGIVRMAKAGWITPMDRPLALAKRIGSLYEQPEALIEASLNALTFARNHTFERTFERRIAHLEQAAHGDPCDVPLGVHSNARLRGAHL